MHLERALQERNGPLRRVSEERQCDRRLEARRKHRFLSIWFRSYSFSNAVEEETRQKWEREEGLIKGI
jgi:hypothetical protein